jgi:hypothetical protein
MNKKIIAISVLVVAAVVIVATSQIFSNQSGNGESRKRVTPTVVTMGFLNQWLAERNSTTTSPYDSGLLKTAPISDEVRAQIERAHTNFKKGDVDPVLCLPKIPNKIDGDEIFQKDNKAIVVVKPRDKNITTEHQAIVSLTLIDEKWLITKLDCTIGEQGPDREFHFEKAGVLLKQSMQAPYNNQNWHLIYEEETVPGFVIPLTFNSETQCVQKDATTATCDPATFTETTKVFIQADMTETGAIVKRMTFE